MAAQDELERNFKAENAALEHDYYQGKMITKTEFFDRQKALRIRLNTELTNIGAPPLPDWKTLWLAADTVAKKLSVLAKRMELE